MGVIPDGLYSATGETLTILTSYSHDQLLRLQEEVERLRRDHVSDPAEAAEALETAGGTGLGRYIPRDPSEMAAYLRCLVTVLGLLIAWHVSTSAVPDPDEIADRVVDRLIEEQEEQD